MGQYGSFATHDCKDFHLLLASLFRPTPSINDPLQTFSDGSYKRHTDPFQYNTYGNHHGYTITIPPSYLLRYIPRRLVWWVAVHNTPTIFIHVITITFVISFAIQVNSSYHYDPQRLGTTPKSYVLSRVLGH
jgi:hypothetical protein